MDIHHAIARWEDEGGAVPQLEPLRRGFKALTLRRILVPIDFSPESLKTLRYAKQVGQQFWAKLHLVHVVSLPPAFLPQRAALPSTVTQEMAAHAGERLRKIAAEFSLTSRPKRSDVRIGPIAEEISEVARTTHAELIAIATRGYTGIKPAYLGSTTENVLRSAPCPVLVVREKEGRSKKNSARKEPTALRIRKILVPLDFSEPSRLGLEYALGFAQEFQATLVLFHAVLVSDYVLADEHSARQMPDLIGGQQNYARAEMEKLRKSISEKGGKVETRLGLGAPAEQITKYAARANLDLIITSTHGQSGLRRAFIGSTAARVVRYATCPVLVVPNLAIGKVAKKAAAR